MKMTIVLAVVLALGCVLYLAYVAPTVKLSDADRTVFGTVTKAWIAGDTHYVTARILKDNAYSYVGLMVPGTDWGIVNVGDVCTFKRWTDASSRWANVEACINTGDAEQSEDFK